MKKCRGCKIEKSHSEFGKEKRVKSGLTSKCRACLYEPHKKNLRLWRERNREHFREYERRRKANNPQVKIAVLLRIRICNAVRRNQKAGSAIKDSGCTIQELKEHIEKGFKEGMSWENHGQWHIDHKVPLASFDLTDREQFLKAVHYTNLQPLWARENISKGKKI